LAVLPQKMARDSAAVIGIVENTYCRHGVAGHTGRRGKLLACKTKIVLAQSLTIHPIHGNDHALDQYLADSVHLGLIGGIRRTQLDLAIE